MPRQTIQFAKAPDGTRIAYGLSGSGPILVKCANWLNHLDFDWESPVWKHWFEFLSRHFTLIRYDERGCGLSDWECADMSFDAWVRDLETVVDANELETFPLLGLSQGAAVAIEYAIRHPERVSHLILFGGFAEGRGGLGQQGSDDVASSLISSGWERDNPAFRQFFASLFVPNGKPEHGQWFVELCRKTANTRNALAIHTVAANLDVTRHLSRLKVPTLVVHARDDAVVPVKMGRHLAAEIPGARFVQLDSANHLLLAEEPAWRVFCEELLHFVGIAEQAAPLPDRAILERLTARERTILGLLGEGLSNAALAEKSFLSEKTIRNHLSSIYDKLGVKGRVEAILLVRSLRQE